jgi:hypothetical protein
MSWQPLPGLGRDSVWTCSCGQSYRRATIAAGVRFWPSSGAAGYSRHGLSAGSSCIRCDRPIPGQAS